VGLFNGGGSLWGLSVVISGGEKWQNPHFTGRRSTFWVVVLSKIDKKLHFRTLFVD